MKIAPRFQLPDEAVTETFAMLAKRGTGKSNAAVVMAEEMTDAGHQWVAIDPKGDWWGIRSSSDGTGPGLEVPVFGGRHGDLPLEATAGALLARLIVERDLTVVLDVSLFSKADQIRFVTDFAEALFRAVGDAPRPLHLFLEEAEEFLPQRVDARTARMVGAYSKIAKQGRTAGLGVSLITQRSASLNKDALSQTDTLILFRTVSPHDRKAVVAWAEHHDEARDVASSLAELKPGESWILSPGFLGSIEKVQWRRRRTFDSGATPVTGKARRKDPVSLADIDLAEIKELMADTVERAKAEDPKELRREIARLQRELADRPSVAPEVVEVEVPVVPPEVRIVAERIEEYFSDFTRAMTAALADFTAAADRPGGAARAAIARRPVTPASPTVARSPRPTRTPPTDGSAPSTVKAGARRMVEVLARHRPNPLTRDQLSTLAHVAKGGTLSDYLRSIVTAGYVVEGDRGVELTPEGVALAGDVDGPLTAEEIVAMYQRDLKAGARRMLDFLVDAYPAGFTRNELSEVAEVAKGGTLSDYIRSIVKRGLAVEKDGLVTASGTLFLGGRHG